MFHCTSVFPTQLYLYLFTNFYYCFSNDIFSNVVNNLCIYETHWTWILLVLDRLYICIFLNDPFYTFQCLNCLLLRFMIFYIHLIYPLCLKRVWLRKWNAMHKLNSTFNSSVILYHKILLQLLMVSLLFIINSIPFSLVKGCRI